MPVFDAKGLPCAPGFRVQAATGLDGLSDLHLPDLVDYFHDRDSIATCLGVRPPQSVHLVDTDGAGLVTAINPITAADFWINGGFFVFRREIFDYMQDGEELVVEPLQRVMAQRKLSILQYEGFWGCMDTYKERQRLEDMDAEGNPPWKVWQGNQPDVPVTADLSVGQCVQNEIA